MTNNSKQKLSKIPIMFENKFPSNYINSVAHWGNFSKNELHQENEEGTQKLLHLDIDLGNYCSLRCSHCFRRDPRFDSMSKGFLSNNELLAYISQAKDLGLQSVKFLGRGEPFENKDFLGFVKDLRSMNIGISVFTKGHVIGSDNLTKKYNTHHNIRSGKELAKELKKLDVSVLLGFNSFKKNIQELFVGTKNSPIKNYVDLRDNALLNLVRAGLNEYKKGEETRLGFIMAPIKPENIDEIFDMYVWGRRRNFYAFSCPTTESGKGLDELSRIPNYVQYISNLKKLYESIYIWNIETNLMTLDQFKEEGVSLYPGNHPCNQTAAGMYLTLSGKIVRCPGRSDKRSTFTEDIRLENDLKSVWLRSENYKRAAGEIKSPEENDMNYRCPARDGRSIKPNFYEEIKSNVLNYFEKK